MLAATAARAAAPAADPGTEQLRRLLTLARSGEFHLVLDLPAHELRLVLGGVDLRRFPCEGIAVATPRRLFRAAAPVADWTDRTWTGGAADPEPERERVEMIPQPGNTQAADLPPPPPPPSTYRIRFADGLDLQVVGADAPPPAPGLGERLALLTGRDVPRLRVRLVLSRTDLEELYRCLPPDVAFAVIGRPGA